MKIKTLFLGVLFLSPVCQAQSSPGVSDEQMDLSHVISDYRTALASSPLDYSLLEKKQLSDVTLQRYSLNSQAWSPQDIVSPANWGHEVDIYIPDSAREKHALVVINNGSNDDGSGNAVIPTNFTEEALSRIATATKTIVISLSNVPNQGLNYEGNSMPLAEDDSVAYTWKLFISDIQKYQNMSLHIPMSASVSQTLRLAKKELSQWNINKFIVTGASKRGWTAWLTALSDPDVDAIVPFVMDLLDTQDALKHMYQSYGNNWPVAFYSYYNQGIDQRIETDEFASLMTLEDPLSYLSTELSDRLNIEKYIINASGDDFYVPDNSRFYYDRLPGPKSLRVVPNSTHNGILAVAETSLISFVNRFQKQLQLPEITENVQSSDGTDKVLSVSFSEHPQSILQWTAQNPDARDFRYACDVKYTSSPVSLAADDEKISIPLVTPESGWQATYVEATFNDGYVASTQVYITPDGKYPETAPASKGASCQTLPGRGLSPDSKSHTGK